ncbi:MAG: pyridoxamine 5'-phosphate oxidase family protein [Pseudonocardiaceae bacterium]
MRETPADLATLQDLLDRSFATAGRHLLSIITPERRLTADQVADRLTGMRLLALATVTADGRPIVGPVDGIFFRGAFHFGSAPDSVRFRHIRNRPQVSATHLPGEELAVTVHGSRRSPRHPQRNGSGVPAGPARHLRSTLWTPMGTVPRLRSGLCAYRGRPDVHVP